jgi:AcrR family transcriptional regulator
MENNVPKTFSAVSPPPSDDSAGVSLANTNTNTNNGVGMPAPATAVGQAVDRTLEGRRAAAQEEVERLVSAAFRVIERTGSLEPKVSDILAEAGLSNQAFYRHFRSKHELLVAVLDEGIRGLGRYLAARMAEATNPSNPSEAIREWIRGMAAQAQDPSGAQASRPFALARGRLAEAFPLEIARSEGQVTAPLRAALEAARASGRMPAVLADQDAESLYHLMMGWVEARLVEARIPEASEVARLEDFIMAGLERIQTDGASLLRDGVEDEPPAPSDSVNQGDSE